MANKKTKARPTKATSIKNSIVAYTKSFRVWIWLVVILVIVSSYYIFIANNVNKKTDYYYFTCSKVTNTENIVVQLEQQNIVVNSYTLAIVSRLFSSNNIQNGMYIIQKGWGNVQIIYHLLNTKPFKYKSITIKSYRKRSQQIKSICNDTGLKTNDLYTILREKDFEKKFKISNEAFYALLIPNTINIPLNIKGFDLIHILKSNFYTYWSNEKLEALKYAELSAIEATILASIVYAETKNRAEMPTIAGVYINRLLKGMKLESDPTVVFANGDWSLRRVYKKHTKHTSRYNTYMYKGLPPGPIGAIDINALEAVINYEQHDYLFFCANPLLNGTHLFSEDYQTHIQTAHQYQQKLNSLKLRKQ